MPILGPSNADIIILGDFPDGYGSGFSKTGEILNKLGITFTSCLCLTLTETSPPDGEIGEWLSDRKTCPGESWQHINGKWVHPTLAQGWLRAKELLERVQPKLVIALGQAPLALLCGQTAIDKWRGSRLSPADWPFSVLPTIHPRTLIKQPDRLFLLQTDLKRAVNIFTHVQVPRSYNFTIRPSFEQATETLVELLDRANAAGEKGEILKLSGDLETRAGHIACFGIAWSPEDAICIPHLVINDTNPFYWSEEEETQIVWLYAQLFLNNNVLWIGQNYLYDAQYFWRHWGILPKNVRDTMIAHHSLHSNIRKGLDFLSSLYAQDHVYWKEESKEWDPKLGEEQYWAYNLKDACITYEIWLELEKERARE